LKTFLALAANTDDTRTSSDSEILDINFFEHCATSCFVLKFARCLEVTLFVVASLYNFWLLQHYWGLSLSLSSYLHKIFLRNFIGQWCKVCLVWNL